MHRREKISRSRLRAILESARGIRPDDKSDAAKQARQVSSYGDFDGVRFIARIGVEPPQNGYKAKNKLDEVITPDRKDWHSIQQVARQANSSAAPSPATPTELAKIGRPEWAK
jgi:hypothetical protein